MPVSVRMVVPVLVSLFSCICPCAGVAVAAFCVVAVVAGVVVAVISGVVAWLDLQVCSIYLSCVVNVHLVEVLVVVIIVSILGLVLYSSVCACVCF